MSDAARLIQEEIPRLRRFARYLTGNAADAEDLAQECVTTALAKIHLWSPGTNMRSWLFTIPRNLHVNALRKARHAPRFCELKDDLMSSGGQPSQELNLVMRDVDHALKQLNDEHRQVLVLIGLGDMTYDEAAAVIARPVGTVRSRLSRARGLLRGQLENSERKGRRQARLFKARCRRRVSRTHGA